MKHYDRNELEYIYKKLLRALDSKERERAARRDTIFIAVMVTVFLIGIGMLIFSIGYQLEKCQIQPCIQSNTQQQQHQHQETNAQVIKK